MLVLIINKNLIWQIDSETLWLFNGVQFSKYVTIVTAVSLVGSILYIIIIVIYLTLLDSWTTCHYIITIYYNYR